MSTPSSSQKNSHAFTQEALGNILAFGEVLQRLHNRLLSEGINVFDCTSKELKEIMCYDDPREPLELYVLPKDKTTE